MPGPSQNFAARATPRERLRIFATMTAAAWAATFWVFSVPPWQRESILGALTLIFFALPIAFALIPKRIAGQLWPWTLWGLLVGFHCSGEFGPYGHMLAGAFLTMTALFAFIMCGAIARDRSGTQKRLAKLS